MIKETLEVDLNEFFAKVNYQHNAIIGELVIALVSMRNIIYLTGEPLAAEKARFDEALCKIPGVWKK
jgi:hypothetical protein